VSPKPGAETCRCHFCSRKRIVVDATTGKRMDHFRKAGRKGGRCKGSGLDRHTRPEART
jgi:hypothetical protein